MGLNLGRSAPRYSSVLVHAGGGTQDDSLTRDAVFMANAFGARLVGVTTRGVPVADLGDAEDEAVDILVDAAGERFKTAASHVHAGVLWRKIAATPSRALLGMAWAADLLMLDLQRHREGGLGAAELETILKRSQRAVLVRTNAGRALALKRALILWDRSAACCRSITSALPLLAKVEYIAILPVKQSHLTSATQSLSDLERGLKVRNMPVQVVHERACDPDESPDDYVRHFNPDILVMSGRRAWTAKPVGDRLQTFKTYAMLSH